MLGEVVGNYRIVSKLAEGGMGEIFVAEHTRVGHRVAVKVLHPHFSHNEQILNRFFNEAKAATAIRHPGIVEFIDCGMHESSGRAFIIKALLEGQDLRGRLKSRQRLPPDEAIHVAVQVADILSATHGQGVVHRDLKPDNIFLERDATGERVRLLDFGIAKLTGFENVEQTFHGAVFGTPPYMSPEQCRGAEGVDHRTDIYALGCVLYEMVCGRPPFPGVNLDEVSWKHVNEPPPDPHLFAQIPDELAAIILRLLEKAPQDRFQSMQEVKQALSGTSVGRLGPDATTERGNRRSPHARPVAVSRTPAHREPTIVYKRTAPIVTALVMVVAGAIAGFVVKSSSGGKGGDEADAGVTAVVHDAGVADAAPPDAPPPIDAAAKPVDAAPIDAKPRPVDAARVVVRPPTRKVSLRIVSVPDRAHVIVNGRRVGRAPITVRVPARRARITLRCADHHTARRTWRPGKSTKIRVELRVRADSPAGLECD